MSWRGACHTEEDRPEGQGALCSADAGARRGVSESDGAAQVVAKHNGVGAESVRRWYLQAQIDSGQRRGATSEELAEIKELKAKDRRLEDDNDIRRRATVFFASMSQ